MVEKNSTVLRLDDISPSELEKAQAERFVRDVKRLLGYSKKFVHVHCPACSTDKPRKIFEKYSLDFTECKECGTIYINPRPTHEILKIYYSKSENYEYWNKYIFPASEKARRKNIFKPRVERVLDICTKYKVGRDTLLEVGTGFGIFCEEVKKTGVFKNVIGIEPVPELADTCRKKGIEIIEKPVEQVNLKDRKIDVVASFEVIEHLFSPKDFLIKSRSFLLPGGLIVLTCPNARGFDMSLLGSASDAFDAEHLNYFNPASLERLLTECGFEVVEITTPGKLDADYARRKILSGGFDVTPYRFFKEILIDRWEELGDEFQQFLADNGLSSHMWAVARKR